MTQRAGVLRMIAVGDIGDRLNQGALPEEDAHRLFKVHRSDLLAFAKISDRCLSLGRRHAKSRAMASAAAIKAEDEARLFRRAAMYPRIDAEGAPPAAHQAILTLEIRKPRPPHERAVAEDPEVG